MNITLDAGHDPDPAYTKAVAEVIPEAVRTLNHLTLKRAAYAGPADVNAVVSSLVTAVERIPQVTGQCAGWLSEAARDGRVSVPSGQWQDRPQTAVTAAQIRADMVTAAVEELRAALVSLREVTSALAPADAEAEAWGGRGPSASYAEWLADEDGTPAP